MEETKRKRNWTRYVPGALFLAFLCVLIARFWSAVSVAIVLVALSAIIAYLLSPLCALFERKFPRFWATITAFAVVVVVLVGFLWMIIPGLYKQSLQLVGQLPGYADMLMRAWESAKNTLGTFGITPDTLRAIETQAGGTLSELVRIVRDALLKMGGGIVSKSWIALSPVAAFYLLRDRDKLFERMQHWVPEPARPRLLKWAGDVRFVIGSYVRGQLTVAFIVGVLTGLGLAIAGVQGYLLLGVCMMVLNLIPYFGSILGMVPILCLSAVQGRVIPAMLISIAVQQLEGAVISPRIMSDVTGVHPFVVMLVLLVGGNVSGSVGMLVAMPLYLVLRVTAKAIYRSVLPQDL